MKPCITAGIIGIAPLAWAHGGHGLQGAHPHGEEFVVAVLAFGAVAIFWWLGKRK